MSFEFGQPSFLALLALLPAWWWWVRPKGLAGLLIARGEPAEALALRGWKARMLETLPNAMRLAALGFLVLALCQPRIVRTLEEPLTEGVGIAFAIDLSTSMWAADMAERTSRLQAANATVLRFLENREDDVGLVSFAGESLIRLRLTHYVYVVEMAVDEMEVGLLTDGTDIAGAIAAGAGLLRDTPHTSKVLILVTDGAHNKAGIVPAVAARAAAAFDVKVYPIAIGDEPGPRAAVNEMETVLTQTARITGGRYFRAPDVEALEAIYDEIDRLEVASEVITEREESVPLGLWLVIGSMVFLAGANTLRGSRWGVLP